MKTLLLTFLFSVIFVHAQKSKNVAILKFVRGKVEVKDPDKGLITAKRGQWIKEGSLVKTGPKSVAKLNFIDKSSMNVGPNSEMLVEKFAKNEAGVIEVISGKIRSKVSKDYMNMKKGQSKLFVKSKSAVMGIRGTEFIFSNHNGNTSAVLLEGSVVFAKNDGKRRGTKGLENLVNKGVSIIPGQFSVASRSMKNVTLPAKLDRSQFSALLKNPDGGVITTQTTKNKPQKKAKIPKGLSASAVQSDSLDIKGEIQKNLKIDIKVEKKTVDIKKASGGKFDGQIKPPDGSLLDLNSGTVMPMTSTATFDQNSGQWQSQDFSVDSAGNIIPPEGIKLNGDGKLLKSDKKTGKLKEIVFDIKPPQEQKPLEKMPTKVFVPSGPTPASAPGRNSNSTDALEVQDSVSTPATPPTGQDWFIPNSQVGAPRFIGTPARQRQRSKVNVRVRRAGD